MPPEIVALIDKPVSLVVVLMAGALIGIAIEKSVNWQNRRTWQKRKARRGQVVPMIIEKLVQKVDA